MVLTLHLSGNIENNLHEGQRVDSDKEVKKYINQHLKQGKNWTGSWTTMDFFLTCVQNH